MRTIACLPVSQLREYYVVLMMFRLNNATHYTYNNIVYRYDYNIIYSCGIGECYIPGEMHKRPSIRSITCKQAGIRDGGASGRRELTTYNTGGLHKWHI